MPSIAPIAASTTTLPKTALELAVLNNRAGFTSLLKQAFPGQAVDFVKPGVLTAGATQFPAGTARFFVHSPASMHDGIQVTVTGNNLKLRDTTNGLSGVVADTPPIALKATLAAGKARLAIIATACSTGRYRVAAGDTLSRLSREVGLTVAQLKTLNRLTTDTIVIGQTLKLPVVAH